MVVLGDGDEDGLEGAECSRAYLTSGEAAAARMFAVLADTAVAGGDVAAVLSGFGKVAGHYLGVVVGFESVPEV